MNPLERILIEKVGRENGFENVLSNQGDAVSLGSARHRTRAEITLDNGTWLLTLPSGLLSFELKRSFPHVAHLKSEFVASSIDLLAQLLRRAAALSQALPNQAELDYEAQVKKIFARFC
jgi:putative restriction endonuclease